MTLQSQHAPVLTKELCFSKQHRFVSKEKITKRNSQNAPRECKQRIITGTNNTSSSKMCAKCEKPKNPKMFYLNKTAYSTHVTACIMSLPVWSDREQRGPWWWAPNTWPVSHECIAFWRRLNSAQTSSTNRIVSSSTKSMEGHIECFGEHYLLIPFINMRMTIFKWTAPDATVFGETISQKCRTQSQ